MTKVDWKELTKEIDDKPTWNETLYQVDEDNNVIRMGDFAFANWRVIYNDGTVVDGPKGYADLKRTDVKSISVVFDNKVLHTVKVVDDFFVIRRRNMSRGLGNGDPNLANNFGMIDPKRCIILATKENIAWVWDDGDIDELKEYGDQSPYRPVKLMDVEKQ